MYGRSGKRSIRTTSYHAAVDLLSPEKLQPPNAMNTSSPYSSPGKSSNYTTIGLAVTSVPSTLLEEQSDKDDLFALSGISPIQRCQKSSSKRRQKRKEQSRSTKQEDAVKSNPFQEAENKPTWSPQSTPFSTPKRSRTKRSFERNNNSLSSIFQTEEANKRTKLTSIKKDKINKEEAHDPWSLLEAITKSPSKNKPTPISMAPIVDSIDSSFPKKSRVAKKLEFASCQKKSSISKKSFQGKKKSSEHMEEAWDFLESLTTSPSFETTKKTSRNSESPMKRTEHKTRMDFILDLNYKGENINEKIDSMKLIIMTPFVENAIEEEHSQGNDPSNNEKELNEQSRNDTSMKPADLKTYTNTCMRTYGSRRSYLQSHDEEQPEASELRNYEEGGEDAGFEDNDEEEEEPKMNQQNTFAIARDNNNNKSLNQLPRNFKKSKEITSISNLKAQGTQTKYQDDLNFHLENLKPYSKSNLNNKCLDLIEFAIRLIEDLPFLKFVKSYALQDVIGSCKRLLNSEGSDLEDEYLCYVIGFVFVTLCDGRVDGTTVEPVLEFTPEDGGFLMLIERLINMGNSVQFSKGKNSKKTKPNKEIIGAFISFQKKLDYIYEPSFLGISLLCLNGLFLNEGLLRLSLKVLKSLKVQKDMHLRTINLLLILYENYLMKLEGDQLSCFDGTTIAILLNIFSGKQGDIKTTKILIFKFLILLTLKQHHVMFTSSITSTILNSIDSEPTCSELQILQFGLLLNLIDSKECLKQIFDSLNQICLFYSKITEESLPYYALLIGTLYSHRNEDVRKVFDETELYGIKLILVRFDCGGLKAMKGKVAEILESFDV